MGKYICIILFLTITLCVEQEGIAQNRKYYNALKKNKKISIAYSKEMLSALEKDKKSVLDKLLITQEQIRKRKEVLYIINKEVELIAEEIEQEERKLKELSNTLDELKKEYAQLIYFASLNMNVQRRMIYILSAESFNNAYKRIIYLKQLTDYRRSRGEKIEESIKLIDSTVVNLTEHKLTKKNLLNEEKSELDSLNKVRKSLNKIVGNNTALIAQVNEQLRKEQVKKNVIKKKVSKEITVREENKKVTETKKSHKLEGDINKKFRSKKRWHIWPLDKCVVLHHFGDYYHPKLQYVVVKNDGIELGATPGKNIHSIFEGTVISVIAIPGDGYSLIIQHGDFYSVYSKVEKVNVKQGQVVNRGEVVAQLSSVGNMPKMIFQLWFKKQKLNPELWLKKR